MSKTISKIAYQVKKLKPGQSIKITLPKPYIHYDLKLIRNKIATAARLYSDCLAIDVETEFLPTEIEGIEIVIYTQVILTRTDFMSAIDYDRHSYTKNWVRDLTIYYELANTITDPEPNEIPKFHL